MTQAGKKVAFNTFVMYAKVLVSAGVTLYSTRLVLEYLGVSDFGVFNLIGSIVWMLAFFNNAISTSLQRYMANAMGMNNQERLEDIWNASTKISLLFGIIMILIFEVVGYYLFSNVLNILPERHTASYIVFHCIVLSTFFSLISTPYDATIIAHEDIIVFSILYTLEAILKLVAAVCLIYVPYDKLISYGIFMALIYINSTIIKRIYCKYKYKECKNKNTKKIDHKLMLEMMKFSTWSGFEPLTRVLSVQGIALLLNVFGGTIANAAYGIANQINGQMTYFSSSLLTAINPQIMRSEGMGDRDRVLRLSFSACKFSFFLLSFFSIPLIVEMPYILTVWLRNVPEYTILFCRFILISTLIAQLTYGLQSAIHAVGKIKEYQLVLNAVRILFLIIVFILLYLKYPIYIAVFYFVITEIINLSLRLFFVMKILNIKFKILFSLIMKLILSCIITYILSVFISSLLIEGFIRLALVVMSSGVLLVVLFRFIILNNEEYKQIESIGKGFFRRFLKYKIKI